MLSEELKKLQSEIESQKEVFEDQLDAIKILDCLDNISKPKKDSEGTHNCCQLSSPRVFYKLLYDFFLEYKGAKTLTGEAIFDNIDAREKHKYIFVMTDENNCMLWDLEIMPSRDLNYNLKLYSCCYDNGFYLEYFDKDSMYDNVSIYTDNTLSYCMYSFKTGMDYSSINHTKLSESIGIISFDEIIKFIKEKYKLDKSRVRGNKEK